MSMQKMFADLYFDVKDRAENKFVLEKHFSPSEEDYDDVVKTEYLDVGKEKNSSGNVCL